MSRRVRRHSRRRKFNVHVYPVVRIKVAGIAARSHRDAIRQATERLSPDVLYRRFDSDDSGYSEEFSHFVVDVAGADDFRRSRHYHSSDEPLIQLLRELVEFHRQPRRHRQQLDSIVAEARKVLRMTV
jgi:hypothetical protein